MPGEGASKAPFPDPAAAEPAGSPQEFQLLLKHIFDHRGLDCRQYKPSYLKRRIGVRMRATSTARYLDYLQRLKRDPDEYRRLLDDLTINVTEFFRDPDVYQALRQYVLPQMLEHKRAKRSNTIRIWSAGCATGEEPYSLSILLLDFLSRLPDRDSWHVRITATDLDERSLQAARRGIYPSFTLLPGMQPERYFRREGEGWRVSEEVAHAVKFHRADLMKMPPYRFLDMILCRNVLIYFERDMQARLLDLFRASLRRDGFLVLGKSEAIIGAAGAGFEPVLRRERIYRKAEETCLPARCERSRPSLREGAGSRGGQGPATRKESR